jgi:hypothetical protein
MLAASFYETKTTDRVSLRFAVDASDPKLTKYPKEARAFDSHSAVEAMNFAAAQATAMYIGFLGDDNRFVTQGWDAIVLAALDEMGGGVVYPNDLINPGSLPSVVFMSRAICEAVGYFALPSLKINYFDNVFRDLGEGVGKYKYLPDVAVQHLSMPHWWATPEQGERHETQVLRDRDTYALWAKWQRQEDIAKARLALA